MPSLKRMERVVLEAFDRHWTMTDLKDLRHYLYEYEHRVQPCGDEYAQWESMYAAVHKLITLEERFDELRR